MQPVLEPNSASQWWRTFQTWFLWPLRRKGRCYRNSSPWKMRKRSSQLQTEQVFFKASHLSNYLSKSSASFCHFGAEIPSTNSPTLSFARELEGEKSPVPGKHSLIFVSPSSFLNRLWPACILVRTGSPSSSCLHCPLLSLFFSPLLSPSPFHHLSFPSFISSHAFLCTFPCRTTSFFLFLFSISPALYGPSTLLPFLSLLFLFLLTCVWASLSSSPSESGWQCSSWSLLERGPSSKGTERE